MEQLGGKLTDELKQRYERSPNWKDGKFVNLIDTQTSLDLWSIPEAIYKMLQKTKERAPEETITVKPFAREDFETHQDSANMVWYGHSAVLINMNGTILFIDPMLGLDASPVAPFRTSRFTNDTLPLVDELPDIDVVLLTHDHYDHLDMDSIKKLKGKVKQYYVALGVKRHLVEWGVAADSITEFDWWDESTVNDITITFTPSRHFSGRWINDKESTLWGGWVLATNSERIYFSGDSGFGPHFKEIGEKLGPFDLGLMECGQYDDLWEDVHLTPEETVQAAIDAKVKRAMPIHWGAFSLSHHSWKDPIERYTKQAKQQELEICYFEPGEIFCRDNTNCSMWWEKYH